MKSLLIVDDEKGIRLLLREIFKADGYHIHLAANGVEALKIIDDNTIDCVLLDMKIPGMDGNTILKNIKATQPQIPILMMTAYGEVEAIETSLKLGAERYFTKPFNILEVREVVNKILTG